MSEGKYTARPAKVAQRKPKAAKTSPKQVPGDAFTQICRKELGVECVREHRFTRQRMWRFDYALPLFKVALEVEGGVWTQGRHVRGKGFLGDIEKYNTATLMGWRVFRTTPDKLYTQKTLLLLKNAISGSFLHENTLFLPEK